MAAAAKALMPALAFTASATVALADQTAGVSWHQSGLGSGCPVELEGLPGTHQTLRITQSAIVAGRCGRAYAPPRRPESTPSKLQRNRLPL